MYVWCKLDPGYFFQNTHFAFLEKRNPERQSNPAWGQENSRNFPGKLSSRNEKRKGKKTQFSVKIKTVRRLTFPKSSLGPLNNRNTIKRYVTNFKAPTQEKKDIYIYIHTQYHILNINILLCRSYRFRFWRKSAEIKQYINQNKNKNKTKQEPNFATSIFLRFHLEIYLDHNEI